MFGILGLGFLLGMRHALEADHIAAVSSIAARRTNIGDIVKHGLTWGLGHTLTLFAFAGAAIVAGHAIPEHSGLVRCSAWARSRRLSRCRSQPPRTG
jgi:high-affinity nickel permease